MEKDFLDEFKESWQNQEQDKSYNQDQIFGMLQRKSKNSVKWIFIISAVELILGLLAAIFYFVPNVKSDSIYQDIFKEYYVYFEIFHFVNLAVILYFVYQFYCGFKKINVESSIKGLIQDIINFRKNANRYIYYNIIVFILLVIPVVWFGYRDEIVMELFKQADPTLTTKRLNEMVGAFKYVKVFVLVVFIGFAILYYRLIYGIFLGRLKRNQKELVKIENN